MIAIPAGQVRAGTVCFMNAVYSQGMYTSHFGLSEPPFSIAPDPRYLYMSKRHREALAHLVYGIREGGGFVQLTGEVGTGKTTLCRGFLEQVPEQVDVALILNPRLSEHGLVSALCDELRIDYPRRGQSIKELTDILNAHLLKRHAEGGRSVLIIDEAQNLSTGVLEQLRLLTNLETNREKLLRIVLIGQPELNKMLARDELRQLNQRITARYHLLPLSAGETRAYVEYRLAVAGRKQPLFTKPALRQVYHHSRGIPRLINIICDRALLGAYSRGAAKVTARVVGRAAREVTGRGDNVLAYLRRFGVAGALLLMFAAGVAVTMLWLDRGDGARGRLAEFWSSLSGRDTAPPVADPVDRWLQSLDGATNDTGAIAALATLWGANTELTDWDGACEKLRVERLRCLDGKGDWDILRRYNRPAVLSLHGAGGLNQWVLLHSLDADHAEFMHGQDGQRFTLAELGPHWNGEFRLLWSSPGDYDRILPGTYSDAVFWLRQRLNYVESVTDDPVMETDDARYFDETLKSRVMTYQRRNGLPENGIVDAEMMIRLNSGLGNPAIPVLHPQDTEPTQG